MSRRSRGADEIVLICWRDIPAQVNGKIGETKHNFILPHRFQKAIDRAAMVAGKKTAQEYVGEWRRTSHPVTGDDIVTIVEETAASIEREFTNERLHALVDNGGWDPVSPDGAHATDPASTSDTNQGAAHDIVLDETGDQPS